jgi:hypothetical protein
VTMLFRIHFSLHRLHNLEFGKTRSGLGRIRTDVWIRVRTDDGGVFSLDFESILGMSLLRCAVRTDWGIRGIHSNRWIRTHRLSVRSRQLRIDTKWIGSNATDAKFKEFLIGSNLSLGYRFEARLTVWFRSDVRMVSNAWVRKEFGRVRTKRCLIGFERSLRDGFEPCVMDSKI